ncbi:MAG TPA: hypothetical protein VFN60_05805 [Acidimicrobiales bacterium]|nr:hypothetical protein [Acidimicrobiales bacterium]
MAAGRCLNRRNNTTSVAELAAARVPVPCSHPEHVVRTCFGRVGGEPLAHAACARCDHDWWELDRQPTPFGVVSDLLSAHYEALTRRRPSGDSRHN